MNHPTFDDVRKMLDNMTIDTEARIEGLERRNQELEHCLRNIVKATGAQLRANTDILRSIGVLRNSNPDLGVSQKLSIDMKVHRAEQHIEYGNQVLEYNKQQGAGPVPDHAGALISNEAIGSGAMISTREAPPQLTLTHYEPDTDDLCELIKEEFMENFLKGMGGMSAESNVDAAVDQGDDSDDQGLEAL